MEKQFGFIIIIIFLVSLICTFSVSAAGSISADSSVTLKQGQKTGTVKISVSNSARFAGCEYAVLCGDGVSIQSVIYSVVNAMTVAPTAVNGTTYFSFYSGSNEFSGTVTATISFSCSGDKNTSILVYTAKIYTKNGAAVDTEKQTLNKLIEIKVEGETNPVDPPKPPIESQTSSGSSSTYSSSTVPNNSNGGSGTNTRTGDSSNNQSSDSSGGGNQSGAETSSSANSSGNNISSESQQTKSDRGIGVMVILSILLGISLLANGALVTLLYQNKKR